MAKSGKKRTRQARRSGGIKNRQQTTQALGSTGSTLGPGTNGAFDSKPTFSIGSTTTGLRSTATSTFVAKASMCGAPTTSTTSAFCTPALVPGTAGGGSLFRATSASTTPGAFAFAFLPPKPAGTGAFGVPAPSGGMFGSTAPASSAGAFSFGTAPAPGSGFGAPATGSLFRSGPTAPASGGFGSALTQQQQQQQQQQKGVENSEQLTVRFERGGHTSGVSASEQGGSNLSGQASPSLGFAYRRTPRSSAHIRPRGLGGPGEGGSSSVMLPRASSTRLLLEGVLAPSGKLGFLSHDMYLSGSTKRISFPSGGVEDAGQRSTASTTSRTVKPVNLLPEASPHPSSAGKTTDVRAVTRGAVDEGALEASPHISKVAGPDESDDWDKKFVGDFTNNARHPPSPPQRRALRNPEDAEAAKKFRPMINDPESQVLSLLGNAWEIAPGEPEHEAARGTVRAGRIVADFGLRLGRGFRASWGPGGVLVCPDSVGGGDAPGKYAVSMKRLNPTPAAFGRDIKSLYVGSLRNHLRFAKPRLDGGNVPLWELPRRKNHKPDSYADLVKCMHGYAAAHAAAGAQCSHSSGGTSRSEGIREESEGKSSEDGPEWVLDQAWRLASAMWGQEEGEGRAQDLPVPGDFHTAASGFGSVGESNGASPAARREAAVADWLANAVASCVSTGERSAAAASAEASEEGRGTWRRVLELLSVRRVGNAAEVAMNAGLPRFAVVLSAAAIQGIGRPVRNDASMFLAEQVALWEANGANAYMPQEAFVAYQLIGREGFRDVGLGGVIGKGSDSPHPSLDWLRQLGLCLWFGAGVPLGDGGGAVADAVKAYESLVAAKEAIPPTARYFREPTHHDKADLDQVCRELRRVYLEGEREELCGVVAETGTGRDRCVLNRLLAMYPSQATVGGGGGASGVALLSALEPMAVTPDVMDYRFSWHLMKVAEALGVAKVPDRLKVAAIAEGMRFQLECAGLWEWAVYVALTIEGDVNRREATAREIVVRHGFGLLGDSLSPKDEERRRLLHELHTPVSWLNEADATRAGYEHQSALPTPAPCDQEDILATAAAGTKAEQARETKLIHLISAASVELAGDMVSEACALAPGSLYLGGSTRRRLAECFQKIDQQLKGGAQARASFHAREGSVGSDLSIDAVGGNPRTKEFDAYKEILEAAEEGAAYGVMVEWTEEKVERLTRMRSVVEPAATRILGRAAACEALSSVWDEARIPEA